MIQLTNAESEISESNERLNNSTDTKKTYSTSRSKCFKISDSNKSLNMKEYLQY